MLRGGVGRPDRSVTPENPVCRQQDEDIAPYMPSKSYVYPPVPTRATAKAIGNAAAIISAGGIAAFPTETVYGLGADATNPAAVARIYAAKGRPGDNPLILHIADRWAFGQLTDNPPGYAAALINAFWPGPLTLVANKKPGLPPWLGGHPSGVTSTAGIRMPSHPVALAVIKASGCIIAAPSANKAGTPSPTLAEHVATDFADGSIDFILDGGPVTCGLESTVVDVTGPEPVILRPGAITAAMISQATGLKTHGFEPGATDAAMPTACRGELCPPAPYRTPGDKSQPEAEAQPRSPGMKYRHYAPKAPMMLLIGNDDDIAAYITLQFAKDRAQNRKTGVLVTTQTKIKLEQALSTSLPAQDKPCCANSTPYHLINLGDKPETIAQNLYAGLRRFDAVGVDIIYAEAPTMDGLGIAIMDRMKKAAEGRIVYVPEKDNIRMHRQHLP